MILADQIAGAVIATLLADSPVAAKCGTRIYDAQSNVPNDPGYPSIAVEVKQAGGPYARAYAADVTMTAWCYSRAGRSEASAVALLVMAAIDNIRLQNTVDGMKYAGVFSSQNGAVEAERDSDLGVWYVKSEYEGRFIRRSS